MRRELYFGDNLDVLREHVRDESVDLIYLDPPFNSNASYNMLFKDKTGDTSEAQIQAFDDTWVWGISAEEALDDIMNRDGVSSNLRQLMPALRSFLGTNDMMAYLVMMAVRLVELHRVLKVTGSLYLHCDPTASHYLKLVLDAVFGPKNFKSEIIWRRTGSHNSSKRYGPIHDTILFYAKDTQQAFFRRNTRPYTKSHVEKAFVKDGDHYRTNYSGNVLTGAGIRGGLSGQVWEGFDPTSKGRHWALPSKLTIGLEDEVEGLNQREKFDLLLKLGRITIEPGLEWPKYEHVIGPEDGQYLSDIWAAQPGTEGTLFGTDEGVDSDVQWLGTQDQERLGYPTQKPLGLLRRIILSSSKPGDTVLDPFCGCGTAVDAAEELGRSWLGIDVTHLAIGLIERRMKDRYPELRKKGAYKVIGTPTTLSGAKRLFQENPFQFERWAVSLIPGAREYKVGGGDGGIDGQLYFRDASTGSYRRGLLSVKGGEKLYPAMIRDLRGVVDREANTDFGIFISLNEPTQGMKTEAASAGFFETGGKRIPVLQTVTIEDVLEGKMPYLPGLVDESVVFRKATKAKKPNKQGRLL